MYKVFIENREVNFTNNQEFLKGDSIVEFDSSKSTINELIPIVLNYPVKEEVYVFINEIEFDFSRLFVEFKFIEAAGGLVEFKNKFLFIKRNGFWDIPKGKLDPDESFEVAARREIEEECGLRDLAQKENICTTFHTYFFKGKWYLKKTNWYHFLITSYQKTLCQEEEGITEAKWFSQSEFSEIQKNTFSSINHVIFQFNKLLEEETQLEKAISFLKDDQVVAIPTETVYGLAANVFSEKAIDKVFKLKKRPQSNPLIVHCDSLKSVIDLVGEFPLKGLKLAEKFWPGPLTLLLPKNKLIPNAITAGSDRVGVRVPNHKLTLKLLNKLDFPLAAPSANLYGSISPTCAEHVEIQFGNQIPLILDGGPCQVGIESTIIGFEEDKTIIYRLGQITIDDIIEVCGEDVYVQNQAGELIVAPGMVKHHYAPKTMSLIVSDFSKIEQTAKTGVILFNEKPLSGIPLENQIVLAKKENFEEASRNLYKAFYTLDQLQLDKIFIKLLPEIGIGKSINDRIIRAGMKK